MRDQILGIVTERDLMTRVLAKALDPERTTPCRGDASCLSMTGRWGRAECLNTLHAVLSMTGLRVAAFFMLWMKRPGSAPT